MRLLRCLFFQLAILSTCLHAQDKPGTEVSSEASVPSENALKIRSFESHGPYCGVYSIVAAAAALGKDVDVATLWVPEVVSEKTGSSVANLIHGLQTLGLDGTCHRGLSWMELADSGNPLILHYRSQVSSGDFDHWVTLLGVDEEGKYLIYDPPFPVIATEPAMVLANWDGIAIEVHPQRQAELRPYFGTAYLVIFFGIVTMIFAIGRRYVEMQPKLLVQLGLIAVGLIGGAYLFHSTSRAGLLFNSTALAAVQDRYFGSDFLEIDIAKLRQLKNEGAILIDARRESSFQYGSIPGAINVPIDSSLPYRERVLSSLDRSKPVIVFCQSQYCDYGDRIGRFLKFNGFANIQVYRNGFIEWEQEDGST